MKAIVWLVDGVWCDMESDDSDPINDVLFMNSLGFSEENIAKLKHMSVIEVREIINSTKFNISNKKKAKYNSRFR